MTPRVKAYLDEAAERHDTTAKDILSDSRFGSASAARIEVMCRLKADGFRSTQIGHWLGRHDSTVRHIVRRYRALYPEIEFRETRA